MVKLKCEKVIKKIKDLETKALRKTKENKKVSKDVVYNLSQQVKRLFILILFFIEN